MEQASAIGRREECPARQWSYIRERGDRWNRCWTTREARREEGALSGLRRQLRRQPQGRTGRTTFLGAQVPSCMESRPDMEELSLHFNQQQALSRAQ
jgi:hypothetical protein